MARLRRALARRRSLADDSGAAIVEFIGLALLLLIPLTYLIITLGRVQAGAFAAESAARDAARASVVTGVAALEAGESPSRATSLAFGRALAVSSVVVEDFGFDPGADTTIELACSSSPCFNQGSSVRADVQVHVSLPGIPGFVHAIAPLRVTVSASASSPVDGLAAP
ncbi:MAG: pilus assembly protein TadE [Actinobacteria bacterium HGW-Actinobacteria-4]|nr:MAG: pilus assembly protein TadE [Actinobacteria bacterium HGW-Actinobacteria-4]